MAGTEIISGDCLDSLSMLPDNCIQCVVTSPPYFGLRDYGKTGQIGLEPTPDAYVAKMVEVFREVRRVLREDGTLWLNLGDSYAATGYKGSGGVGKGTIANGKGQATNKGSFFGDVSKRRSADYGLKDKDLIGIPWRVAFALQADGWYLRQDIIWSKPNPMPESVRDRCTKAHEYIFMLSKSQRYYYDADAIAEPLASASVERLSQANLANQKGSERVPGKTNGTMKAVAKQDGHGRRHAGFNGRYFGQATKDYEDAGAQNASDVKRRIVDRILAGEIITRNKRSVWTVTTKPFKGAHFATFPPDLIEPCILAGSRPGDTVLDPFGGSGTTGMVANRHGRRAILLELNEDYCAMARTRIAADAQAQIGML